MAAKQSPQPATSTTEAAGNSAKLQAIWAPVRAWHFPSVRWSKNARAWLCRVA